MLFVLVFLEKVARVPFSSLWANSTSMAGAARADTAYSKPPDSSDEP